jgi:hypothetical protein
MKLGRDGGRAGSSTGNEQEENERNADSNPGSTHQLMIIQERMEYNWSGRTGCDHGMVSGRDLTPHCGFDFAAEPW